MKCPSPSRRTIPLSPAAAAVSAVPLLPSYLARSLYAEPLREHLSPTSWLFIQPPRPQSPLFLAPSRLGVFALSGSSASGCKLHQSSRHAPSCRPPRCAQPQSRRVVCPQKGKSPLSVPAIASCRWTERQRKAANPPGRKEAGRKLVPRRVERGRSHVAQCVDRFCKLNTYYRPDPKIPHPRFPKVLPGQDINHETHESHETGRTPSLSPLCSLCFLLFLSSFRGDNCPSPRKEQEVAEETEEDAHLTAAHRMSVHAGAKAPDPHPPGRSRSSRPAPCSNASMPPRCTRICDGPLYSLGCNTDRVREPPPPLRDSIYSARIYGCKR